MSIKAIVLLADGFEEVEAVTPIDYLRRAGIEVTIASVGSVNFVKGSHGIEVGVNVSLDDLVKEKKLSVSGWDAVIVPGGMGGSLKIAASKEAGAFLKEMAGAGKLVCAICAAPARVLFPLGILAGKNFTCYPGQEENVNTAAAAMCKQDRVVVDGNLITSRAAGTAGEFACKIIEKLAGEAGAKKLAEKVLL